MAADPTPREGAFISYARSEGESFALALQARLAAEAPDIRAWLDRNELEGGVGWWNQIERELDRAEFLLLVMTPAAMRSENTRREWRSARQRGVCVYPIKGVADAELDYASLPRWMGKSHFYDLEREWPTLLAHLRRGCRATRVPFMAPPLPAGFVERADESGALAASLLGGQSRLALRAPGGFGKTTMASAICHDNRSVDHFDDGILWVTLGQTPNLLNELVKLYAALTGERPAFIDLEDAARELAARLEGKACLLVLDDVWKPAHLRPFIALSGPSLLVTTRVFDVAAELERVELAPMSRDDARQLLLARSGLQAAPPRAFDELVDRLGDWPLLLKLAGSTMRQRMLRKDAPERAIEHAIRTYEKRGVTAFDVQDSNDRADTIERCIGAGLDLLDADARRRWAELAIFPETLPIPLNAAASVWGLDEVDSEDLARRLDDLALVDFDLARGTLRLHDVLQGYMAARLNDAPALHARLLAAWGDPATLPDAYAWRTFAHHLRRAGQPGALRALLLDLRWLDAKLRATGLHALLNDFEPEAHTDAPLGVVRDALRLSAAALTVDPRGLRTQLAARLALRPESELRHIVEACAGALPGPWLRLQHPTLDAPGGMLHMTLVDHEGEVTALVLAAGGERLLSASADGSVRLWDRAEGRFVEQLFRQTLGIFALAAAASADLALSGGANGLLRLIDLARPQARIVWTRRLHAALRSLALSADASLALTVERGTDLRLWDTASRGVLRRLKGHGDQVNAVAMSADGSRAVSGADDRTLRVWNLQDGSTSQVLEGHAGAVNAVAMSADGRLALSGSSDCSLRLWDTASGRCLGVLDGHQASVTAVALASTGRRALSGSSDGTVRLWDLDSGTPIVRLEGHSDAVRALALDEDGTWAATGSADRTIKLWRLDKLAPAAGSIEPRGSVTALLFSPDARHCACGSANGGIEVLEVASGRIVRRIGALASSAPMPIRSLAFTPDGSCVLSGGLDGQYVLWGIATGEATLLPIRRQTPIVYCAMSPSARFLVTACADRFVYLWDLPSGAPITRFGTRRLFDPLIVPDPQRQALADPDDALLDQYLGAEERFEIAIVRMSPDGRSVLLSAVSQERGSLRAAALPRAASTGGRACVMVFDIASGELRWACVAQTEPIVACAVDARAERLLLARADHVLELWDLRRRERIGLLAGHVQKVNAVAFSADGRRAYSCSRDRSLRGWDLAGLQCVTCFVADAPLRTLAVAADGSAVAVGDNSGRVHVLRPVDDAG